jgi:hypothetical protein
MSIRSNYLFVDAGLPQDGRSRLDLFDNAAEAQRFRQSALKAGGFLPTWSDQDLRQVIPDDELRRRFVAELTPVPLAVYEEPLPVFSGWPDAPCAYLRFGDNPAYAAPAAHAQQAGWPYLQLDGHHFHMVNLCHLRHPWFTPQYESPAAVPGPVPPGAALHA